MQEFNKQQLRKIISHLKEEKEKSIANSAMEIETSILKSNESIGEGVGFQDTINFIEKML